MVVRKRKKRVKMRGSHFHGHAKKKHRGGGSRGGRGMGGVGKGATHKKRAMLKEYGQKYYGKIGFSSIMSEKIRTINIRDLPEGKEINLTLIGYDKLLGKGNISRAVKVIVKKASKQAIEKIKKSKGEIVLENGSV